MLSAGLVASVALALAGCPSSDSMPRLGDQFVLGIGDTTSIAFVNLRIRFQDVAFDTRCPTQVTCVAPGDAAVVIESGSSLGDSQLDTLHTDTDQQTVVLGRLIELRLARLDPYPTTTTPIPPRAYRLTLVARELELE